MKPVNLQGHSRPIKKVKFNQSGELLYTASSDRTIISWSIPKGEKLKTYTHSAAINTFCVTNKYLISGDNTGTLYIWDISTEKILKKLEHDPTLSVRSLDFLYSDQSQIMIVYAGRGKMSKSFISIYNINEILNYGDSSKEVNKEEIGLDEKNKINNSAFSKNVVNAPIVNSVNYNFNNNNNFKNNYQEKSIYDEDNSIYSIYANKPKQPSNQGNIHNNNQYSNNMNNPNNYNLVPKNQYGQQNLDNTGGYRFNNNYNNNNSTYNFNANNYSNYNNNNDINQNSNSIYNQGNYRFNNNNNNQQFNNQNRGVGGSIYNMNNNNNNYKNQNFPMNNFNNNDPNSIYNRNVNTSQNFDNNFNPRIGNNFDPNPVLMTKIDNPAKTIVSYENIIPMKQIEQPGNDTKYVMAKFFPFNNSICIAVSKENGNIEFINYVSSKKIHEEKLHDEIIFDFDFDIDKNIFLSVSKDGTATVFDFDKYAILKKFKPDNPIRFLNSCRIYRLNKELTSISELKEKSINNKEQVIKLDADKIFDLGIENGLDALCIDNSKDNGKNKDNLVFVVAGGQDSKLVTTTKEGGFEILGYILEDDKPIFSHLANFGPVNTIDLNQKINYFASGAEDSTVKILNFEFLLTCNK